MIVIQTFCRLLYTKYKKVCTTIIILMSHYCCKKVWYTEPFHPHLPRLTLQQLIMQAARLTNVTLLLKRCHFTLHCMAFSHVGDPENCFLLTVHHTYSPHQWIASRRGHRACSRQLPCAFTEMCMAFEDEFTECVSHFLLTIKMLILELL